MCAQATAACSDLLALAALPAPFLGSSRSGPAKGTSSLPQRERVAGPPQLLVAGVTV